MAVKASSVLLCTDFDETITLHDTTSLLFQLTTSSIELTQQLVTQYVDEVGRFVRRYEAKWQQQNRSSKSSRDFDRAGLRDFLTEYAAVDLRSVRRVVKNRALKGIRVRDLAKLANVQIRTSCAETLAITGDWRLISVNWSKRLVETVLAQAGVVYDTTQIIANELEVDEQDLTTGIIDVKLQSPMDKEKWITKIQSMQANTQRTIVYVGDSVADLLAQLAADVGIWIAPDTLTSSGKLFRQVVENYGIAVQPLTNRSSFRDCVTKPSDGRPVLFTITDWAQLKMIFESAF